MTSAATARMRRGAAMASSAIRCSTSHPLHIVLSVPRSASVGRPRDVSNNFPTITYQRKHHASTPAASRAHLGYDSGLTAFTVDAGLPGKPYVVYRPLIGLPAMTADLDTRLTTSARDFGLLTLRIGVGAPMLHAGVRKFVDFDTTTGFMESGGWRRRPSQRSWSPSPRPSAGWACSSVCSHRSRHGGRRRDDRRLGGQRVGRRVLVRAVQRAVPDRVRRDGPAFHGCRHLSRWTRSCSAAPRWPGVVTVGCSSSAVAAAVATWILLNGTNPIHVSIRWARTYPRVIIATIFRIVTQRTLNRDCYCSVHVDRRHQC